MNNLNEKEKSILDRDANDYGARQNGNLLDSYSKKYSLIDLFCGAGGMSLGFSSDFDQPFEPVWANDENEYCVETYNNKFGKHCVPGDIVDLLEDPSVLIPEADVVIGGPPCQGFSLLNKKRLEDPRKALWKPFLEVVKRSGASMFVMENVPQILNTYEHRAIEQSASDLGFKVFSTKLLAADFGVPQSRVRAFIFGSKFVDPKVFPLRKTHFNPENKERALPEFENGEFVVSPTEWQTVRNAIGDLPQPIGAEIGDDPPLDLHFGRNPTDVSKQRYRAIPNEGMNRFDLQEVAPELTPQCWINKKSGGTDLFGRLWWDRPAFTIRTEFFKPEKGRYLHPEQHRPITHREAARFQSFPDNFKFSGSKIEIAKQIGNAVPPLLATRVADLVRVLLDERKKDGRLFERKEKRHHVARR